MIRSFSLIFYSLLAVLLAQPDSARAETFSIATGSPNGLYFPFGGGLASLWSKELPDVNMKAEVTSASVTNIIQVSRHESEAGISQGDALRDAIAGKGKFPEAMPVAVLFALYPNVVHFVTSADSDIHSIQDIKGKRISVGAPGSGTAVTTNNILNAVGISPEDFSPQYLNYGETSDAIKNGIIDGGFMVGGLGLAAMVELALTRDVRLVQFSNEDMATISAAYPAYSAFAIPAETYKGQEGDVQTPTLWNFLIVHKDMDDELAYELTKTALENGEALMAITKSAKFMTPENTRTFAPGIVHPGAMDYLNSLNSEQTDGE